MKFRNLVNARFLWLVTSIVLMTIDDDAGGGGCSPIALLLCSIGRQEGRKNRSSGSGLVEAAVACVDTNQCELSIRRGSQCINGFCTNPYQSGCLWNRLSSSTSQNETEEDNQEQVGGNNNNKRGRDATNKQHMIKKRKRICNSDDPIDAASLGICRLPQKGLEYMEIRIASENWESVFFEAWILQILLSEILDVPTSIETGIPNTTINFYHPNNPMDYGTTYVWDGLQKANEIGDCRLLVNQQSSSTSATTAKEGQYQSCTHIIPEVWTGDENRINALAKAGVIEPTSFIGIIGQEGWFIPKFTAKRDSTLLSYFGLMGEENRHKLAQRFLRPTTWDEYCTQVSENNCSIPSSIAIRPPRNKHEKSRMFVNELYYGFFRPTDENNCTKYRKNCTGHITDYPCGWSSWVAPQTYHLDIGLKSSGTQPGSNGYTYSQMTEIWHAANWSQTDVVMQWWTPEALHQSFIGTESEFQMIAMPPPTHQCIRARVSTEDRCNGTSSQQVGNPIGICADPPLAILKVIVSKLAKMTNDPDIPLARRSPGYDAIKNFHINEFQLSEIFEYWLRNPDQNTSHIDKYGFDPRDATCRWVIENLDALRALIPTTFPRAIQENTDSHAGAFFAVTMSLSLVSIVLVIGSCLLTYHLRRTKAIVYAQVEFMFLLLVGLLFVSGASFVEVINPTNATCLIVIWLVNVGYCLELVPLVIKVAAINRLMHAALQMKRIQLKRRSLFEAVAFLSFLAIVYLALWTALDPPQRNIDYKLTDTQTNDGETIILATYYCQSVAPTWKFVSVGAQFFLLICASILAFQTRRLRKDINETQTIAFLIYSHFMFVSLRLAMYMLGGSLKVDTSSHILSLIYSVDSISTVFIYFVPKFFYHHLVDDSNHAVCISLACLAGHNEGSHNSMNPGTNDCLSTNLTAQAHIAPANMELKTADGNSLQSLQNDTSISSIRQRCENCGFTKALLEPT